MCAVHPETVRTLLAFSHGSGMVQGFEWGFETFPNDLGYIAPVAASCGVVGLRHGGSKTRCDQDYHLEIAVSLAKDHDLTPYAVGLQ